LNIAIVACEASGDLLGAQLIAALRERCPDIKVEGVGGPLMKAAGCHSLFDIERLSVMGLVEPLFHLRDLLHIRRTLFQYFSKQKPQVFIGIDAPDFNLGLEVKLRKAGVTVVHYVSPSVWAWRQKRIHKIAKAVNLILTLFPFEAAFYEKHLIPVQFVGHPLAAKIPLKPDRAAARRALCLNEGGTYVALLPGSRRQEIQQMAAVYLQAAKLLWEKDPSIVFLTSHINERRYQEFYACYQKIAPEIPIHFFTQRAHDVMCAADVAVVTSGTATLETMLCKTPMVIAYRMPQFTYWLAKKLVKTPHIGLPNLLAQERIVPELVQHEATAEKIAESVSHYLNDKVAVAELESRFTALHQQMQVDTNALSADAILKLITH
jgi:lipid-A-disaccharide synthase